MSENTETAILAGGCFRPAQELLRHRLAIRYGHRSRRRARKDGGRPARPRHRLEQP